MLDKARERGGQSDGQKKIESGGFLVIERVLGLYVTLGLAGT
jgi:hypothetical protein